MGIRETQFIGLNGRAEEFLKRKDEESKKLCTFLYTETVTRTYPDGSSEVIQGRDVYEESHTTTDYNSVQGMFGEEIPLEQYTFKNGEVYFEYEQHEVWSSGPMIYTALKDKDGNPVPESLWKDSELEH